MDTEKSQDEVNEIINELRNLKKFNIDEYRIKIRELKKNDPSTYFKTIIVINLDDEEYIKTQSSYQSAETFSPGAKKEFSPEKQEVASDIKPAPKKKQDDEDFFSQRIKEESLAMQKEREKTLELNLAKEAKNPAKSAQKKDQGADLSKEEAYSPKSAEKLGENIFEKKSGLEIKQEQLKKQATEIVNKARKKISIGFTIVAISIIAIASISIVGLFLLMNPPSGQAINSLRLGYELFNELDNVYLNYTFLYNSTENNYLGKQYYSLKYLGITSVIEQPRRNIISKEQNNFLYYDLTGNMTKTDLNSLQIDNALMISLYSEAYNLVKNYYVAESGKEALWTMGNYECAPIFFEMNTTKEGLTGLVKLRYEMCLNDNGIPIAIAKEKITTDSRETIIAYLESIESDVKFIAFSNKTLDEWAKTSIDDY